MQGTPEGDIYFLKATADAENWNALFHASSRQFQRHFVPAFVVGFMTRMRVYAEMGRMYIRSRAGQQYAIDDIQKRADIRYLR